MTGKKILVTGRDIVTCYNRTLVILNGLKRLGYEIVEFNFKKFDRQTAKKLQELSRDAYFTFVPSFGHKSVSFVKKNVSSNVVFDPLISKYMTNIADYRSFSRFSYEALRSMYRDKNSISKADFVIFDTIAHRDYFVKKYGIRLNKTGIVYVGGNSFNLKEELFTVEKNPEIFRVGFIGHFIPLQGVLQILETARLMKAETNIEFYLIGKGFEFEKAKNFAEKHQLKQVYFKGKIDYEHLPAYIKSFDLCLGIFGHTLKSTVVIPNKIFNYASCAKPVLTMQTDAIEELFTHNKDIFLCQPNGEDMARAILKLKNDPVLLEKLGKQIYRTVMRKCCEEGTAAALINQYENFKNSAATAKTELS